MEADTTLLQARLPTMVAPGEALGVYWERISQGINSLPVDLGFSADDVTNLVYTGQWQLWDAGEGIALTTIGQTPQYQECVIVMVSGTHMGGWFGPLMEQIEAFARMRGCRYITENGRDGWQRVGPRYGFEKAWVTMRKEL